MLDNKFGRLSLAVETLVHPPNQEADGGFKHCHNAMGCNVHPYMDRLESCSSVNDFYIINKQ